MAAYDPLAAGELPPGNQGLTATERATLQNHETALGRPGIDRALAAAPTFILDLSPNKQVASGGTATSLPFTAPFPFRILQIQAGGTVYGGSLSAATCDVQRKPAGGSYATVLDAAIDIEDGGAGVEVVDYTEDDEMDIAKGTQLKAIFSATGDTVDGATCRLVCKRL